MTDGVKDFLLRLGLGRHYDMFVAKGYDSEGDVTHLNGEDLDSMYIFEEVDRRKILDSASRFQPSREYLLYEWLRELGLDHYFISFVQSALVDLSEIGHLNLPDDQLYDELEITLPGHQRRLERAVRHLAKRQRTALPSIAAPTTDKSGSSGDMCASTPGTGQPQTAMEVPVAYGRWGKPRCLLDAKYDFLILDATVVSTRDPRDKVKLEFMVDSGSDVVTIRQEVLDTLDLELIGPINSKGVHASRRKNLYSANMLIGNQTVQIEVMGETYDSIGSRVIRHFRHYINGDRHIWLKGDFTDPTMLVKPSQPLPSQESVTLTSESVSMTSQVPVLDQSVPCSQENLPVVPSEQSSSNQPEEQKEKSESMETSDANVDKNIQKDFVQKKKDAEYALEPGVEVDSNKINFEFSKIEEVANYDKDEKLTKLDETDKILCNNNEIIDIRPIIAANRKRRAQDDAGFDPNNVMEDADKSYRRDECSNGFNPIGSNGLTNTAHVQSVSHMMDETQDSGHTVLNVRSVYYRSHGSGTGDLTS